MRSRSQRKVGQGALFHFPRALPLPQLFSESHSSPLLRGSFSLTCLRQRREWSDHYVLGGLRGQVCECKASTNDRRLGRRMAPPAVLPFEVSQATERPDQQGPNSSDALAYKMQAPPHVASRWCAGNPGRVVLPGQVGYPESKKTDASLEYATMSHQSSKLAFESCGAQRTNFSSAGERSAEAIPSCRHCGSVANL